MQSEKAVAETTAQNIRTDNGLTMNTIPQNKPQFNSRRELLEQSKLSRLPQRQPFRSPDDDNAPTNAVVVVAVCAACGSRLDPDDNLQMRFSGCFKCVLIYSKLDAAFDESSNRRKKELLEKFAGGVK